MESAAFRIESFFVALHRRSADSFVRLPSHRALAALPFKLLIIGELYGYAWRNFLSRAKKGPFRYSYNLSRQKRVRGGQGGQNDCDGESANGLRCVGNEAIFQSMKKEIEVVIERDAEGYFVATVPALSGCHTQAKSLDVLRTRISEAIELCLEEYGFDTEPSEFIGLQLRFILLRLVRP